jgi:hypothetical protein
MRTGLVDHLFQPRHSSEISQLVGQAVTPFLGSKLIIHGEYGHAVPPLVVATLSLVVGWISWRKRMVLAEPS